MPSTYDRIPDSTALVQPPGFAASPARPIKVMHLVFKLGLGGLEVGVVKLANGFDRAKIQPAICTCLPSDMVKQHLKGDVALFEMNRKRLGNDYAFVLRLAALLRRERPDVLHTHSWATLFEGLVAARLTGVPIVVHGEHGTIQERKVPLQRFLWGRVDRLLSVSDRLSDKMAVTMGFERARIQTLVNGVDTVRFRPDRRVASRSKFGFGADDVVVGTVGRLEPVKDQAGFIGAISVLASRGRSIKAVIGGDGALRQQLESQATALGLADRVTFLGRRLDVEDVMASLDIFVLSSTSEGMSNTILEAMASGLPVVATDVGGAAELVIPGHTGTLVPPSDVTALADAIEALAGDGQRRQSLGREGRVRATTVFGLDTMVRSYEDMYVQVMAQARRT